MFKAKPYATFLGLTLLLAPPLAAPALADDQPIKVSSPQAVKGASAIVIGAFNVGFIFQSLDKTKATGGMIGAFGGVTDARSVLVGVTPAMMQSIVDAAYADFRAQLTAKRFTVVDPAAMFASADFSHVKPMASPVEASVYIDKKSTGKTAYYKPTAIPGQVMLPGDIVGTGFSSMGMQMSFGYTQYGMAQHAKSTGQSIVDVIYLIDFSNTKRPGAFSMSGLKVSSGMSVAGTFSKLNLVSPSGKTASIVLQEPVAVEGDFADMQDTTKGGGVQKAMNIMGGLAAIGGMGGMKFGKSKTFTFTAKPGLYEAGATKAASMANSRMVDKLAALR